VTRPSGQRVNDIFEACGEVADVVALRGVPQIPHAVLTRALERLLELIGEAANSMTEEERAAYPDVPWRDITRLRIVLAHHYQRVDPQQVWAIAFGEIPRLAGSLGAPTRRDNP